MNRSTIQLQQSAMAQHEGLRLVSAAEAMLKGVLEADVEISLIAGPVRAGFAPLFEFTRRTMSDETIAGQIIRQHGMRVVATPDASRAVALARQQARAGRSAIVVIPNDEIEYTIASLAALAKLHLSGAICLILEDSPQQARASCPRRTVQRLDLPCLEPADLPQWRDSIEHAIRLSKAGHCPAAIVVHDSILRSADTLVMRPNRILGSMDAILASQKKGRSHNLRWTEAPGNSPMRVARRLELNRFRSIPNPGERVSVGFITVGPADTSLAHITHTLGLHGRIPVLQLGFIHPLDESAIGRMLTRCQQVIVLEPRPGALEAGIVAVAEAMRHQGEQPGSVWGRKIPGEKLVEEFAHISIDGRHADANEFKAASTFDVDLNPSRLVRRIAHLLHAVRPTADVASQLTAIPKVGEIPDTARDSDVGSGAAVNEIKSILSDVDQWLRERSAAADSEVEKVALAVEGAVPPAFSGRIVHVEIWNHHQFQYDGVSSVVQAADELLSGASPRLFIVCEVSSEQTREQFRIRDLERFTRGIIPGSAADRVNLERANLAEPLALRDFIRDAATSDRMTVIIVHDGPPSKFDVGAIERSMGEIDRLGYEPRQRLVREAGEICGWSHAILNETDQRLTAATDEDANSWLKNEYLIEPAPHRGGMAPRVQLRVRPMLEELEVVRTRPPLRAWQMFASTKLPLPVPIHAKAPAWRAHLAGFRSETPGLAAKILCEAGRAMGYHVRSIHDPTPIATGRRAWAQVLFTQPTTDKSSATLSPTIPYGEADVLFGWGGPETLRAIGPDPMLRIAHADRTFTIASLGIENIPAAVEEEEWTSEQTRSAILAVSRKDRGIIDDFAAACRTWFHTDRVVDVAMLGAAFQLGLIPISVEAIEGAVHIMQARGYGRLREVFDFGRLLAVEPRLFERPKDDREEDVSRLARRMVLSLSRGAWGGGSRARNFSQLLRESLNAMPGLSETEAGREARRNFVLGCHRCRIWGGLVLTQRYVQLIHQLYQADRGDTGRALTRAAILPLADVILIRDPLYIAGMATSPEQRRRLRHRMNVKVARGDRMERRYLTRVELVAFGRRYRADVRTSDWPARTASLLRRAMPQRWRGTRRERELREYVIEIVQRATAGAATDYETWQERLQRLHNQASEDRLRGMALAEVKMLVGE